MNDKTAMFYYVSFLTSLFLVCCWSNFGAAVPHSFFASHNKQTHNTPEEKETPRNSVLLSRIRRDGELANSTFEDESSAEEKEHSLETKSLDSREIPIEGSIPWLEEMDEEASSRNCTTGKKKNERYTSSFYVNTTNPGLSVDKEFNEVVGNESNAKRTSSVHVGEDITLCWIETTTVKEDRSFKPPKRLVLREYTISFENSATIPDRYLECRRLNGELEANDPEIGKTALFEVVDEDTKVSRTVNFTSVSHIGDVVIWQHVKVKCGVGPVVTKNQIEWKDGSKIPKKRVEIKVSPKIHRLKVGGEDREKGPCTTIASSLGEVTENADTKEGTGSRGMCEEESEETTLGVDSLELGQVTTGIPELGETEVSCENGSTDCEETGLATSPKDETTEFVGSSEGTTLEVQNVTTEESTPLETPVSETETVKEELATTSGTEKAVTDQGTCKDNECSTEKAVSITTEISEVASTETETTETLSHTPLLSGLDERSTIAPKTTAALPESTEKGEETSTSSLSTTPSTDQAEAFDEFFSKSEASSEEIDSFVEDMPRSTSASPDMTTTTEKIVSVKTEGTSSLAYEESTTHVTTAASEVAETCEPGRTDCKEEEITTIKSTEPGSTESITTAEITTSVTEVTENITSAVAMEEEHATSTTETIVTSAIIPEETTEISLDKKEETSSVSTVTPSVPLKEEVTAPVTPEEISSEFEISSEEFGEIIGSEISPKEKETTTTERISIETYSTLQTEEKLQTTKVPETTETQNACDENCQKEETISTPITESNITELTSSTESVSETTTTEVITQPICDSLSDLDCLINEGIGSPSQVTSTEKPEDSILSEESSYDDFDEEIEKLRESELSSTPEESTVTSSTINATAPAQPQIISESSTASNILESTTATVESEATSVQTTDIKETTEPLTSEETSIATTEGGISELETTTSILEIDESEMFKTTSEDSTSYTTTEHVTEIPEESETKEPTKLTESTEIPLHITSTDTSYTVESEEKSEEIITSTGTIEETTTEVISSTLRSEKPTEVPFVTTETTIQSEISSIPEYICGSLGECETESSNQGQTTLATGAETQSVTITELPTTEAEYTEEVKTSTSEKSFESSTYPCDASAGCETEAITETQTATAQPTTLLPTTTASHSKLKLKVLVLLEDEANEGNNVEVEKELFFDEDEKGHTELLEQIKSLNETVRVPAIQALLNDLSKLVDDVTRNISHHQRSKHSDSGRRMAGIPGMDISYLLPKILSRRLTSETPSSSESVTARKRGIRSIEKFGIPTIEIVGKPFKQINDKFSSEPKDLNGLRNGNFLSQISADSPENSHRDKRNARSDKSENFDVSQGLQENFPRISEGITFGLRETVPQIEQKSEVTNNQDKMKPQDQSITRSKLLDIITDPRDNRIHTKRKRSLTGKIAPWGLIKESSEVRRIGVNK